MGAQINGNDNTFATGTQVEKEKPDNPYVKGRFISLRPRSPSVPVLQHVGFSHLLTALNNVPYFYLSLMICLLDNLFVKIWLRLLKTFFFTVCYIMQLPCVCCYTVAT